MPEGAELPEHPLTKFLEDLHQAVDRLHPDPLEIAFRPIADRLAWLVVLDAKGELYCYRASLSLDDRWTISPSYVR